MSTHRPVPRLDAPAPGAPEIERLHFPDGYVPAGGGKVRAVCHCGHATTPRVSRERARQALFDEHGFTGGGSIEIECGICSYRIPRWDHWSRGGPWPWEVFQPLLDEARGREVYVCRDQDACHARYRARVAADRMGCGCSAVVTAVAGHQAGCARTTGATAGTGAGAEPAAPVGAPGRGGSR